MNFEVILIKNALSSQTTEFQLSPEVAHYAIPSYIWNKWSDEIQNSALEAFLKGKTPFHLEYDVSENGNTCHQKLFGVLAGKPGTHKRHRNKATSIIIRKSERESMY